jgi:hypothetical protein
LGSGDAVLRRREAVGAEIPDGAVIIARAIVNSSLWTMRDKDLRMAIYCIVKANWRARRWFDGRQSITIKRGQFAASLNTISQESGLSMRSTRTSLLRLEKCGFLTRKSTSSYSLIELPKYEFYQDLSRYSDSIRHGTRHATDTTPTRPRHDPDTTPTTIEEREEGKQQQEGKERKEGSNPALHDFGDLGDPLNRPSPLDSLLLLEPLKVGPDIATPIANRAGYAYVWQLVEHAKRQKNPGGYIRKAVSQRYVLTPTLTKAGADALRSRLARSNGATIHLSPPPITPAPPIPSDSPGENPP